MKEIHLKFMGDYKNCTREDAIEALWTGVEDGTEAEMMSYMREPIRLLGWYDASYDSPWDKPEYCRSIGVDYWFRNTLFTLLVLAAEGELEAAE
jgi:hypothetical protein